ncbi:hypothetical protein ASF36_21760 [Methylobacterium sp. Leaf90]|nr:hypothetical protein ASF36_21760 [Methylobacterium sp. Leaf90]KQQ11667.1 hypothetical protein ASF59_01795 [Methylobacterium sp. Leaf121]
MPTDGQRALKNPDALIEGGTERKLTVEINVRPDVSRSLRLHSRGVRAGQSSHEREKTLSLHVVGFIVQVKRQTADRS